MKQGRWRLWVRREFFTIGSQSLWHFVWGSFALVGAYISWGIGLWSAMHSENDLWVMAVLWSLLGGPSLVAGFIVGVWLSTWRHAEAVTSVFFCYGLWELTLAIFGTKFIPVVEAKVMIPLLIASMMAGTGLGRALRRLLLRWKIMSSHAPVVVLRYDARRVKR